jgi:hypothetical protein
MYRQSCVVKTPRPWGAGFLFVAGAIPGAADLNNGGVQKIMRALAG